MGELTVKDLANRNQLNHAGHHLPKWLLSPVAVEVSADQPVPTKGWIAFEDGHVSPVHDVQGGHRSQRVQRIAGGRACILTGWNAATRASLPWTMSSSTTTASSSKMSAGSGIMPSDGTRLPTITCLPTTSALPANTTARRCGPRSSFRNSTRRHRAWDAASSCLEVLGGTVH